MRNSKGCFFDFFIYHFSNFILGFLAHLGRRLKWAFLFKICCRCRRCRKLSTFSSSYTFTKLNNLLLQNHWANFNQTLHNASLGEGNSSLFKWMALSFSKGKYCLCKRYLAFVKKKSTIKRGFELVIDMYQRIQTFINAYLAMYLIWRRYSTAKGAQRIHRQM